MPAALGWQLASSYRAARPGRCIGVAGFVGEAHFLLALDERAPGPSGEGTWPRPPGVEDAPRLAPWSGGCRLGAEAARCVSELTSASVVALARRPCELVGCPPRDVHSALRSGAYAALVAAAPPW